MLEAKRKAEQKALQERIQEKETKLAGKEEKELLEHIKGWETQKEQRKAAQKTAKKNWTLCRKADGSTGGFCGHPDAGSSG